MQCCERTVSRLSMLLAVVFGFVCLAMPLPCAAQDVMVMPSVDSAGTPVGGSAQTVNIFNVSADTTEGATPVSVQAMASPLKTPVAAPLAAAPVVGTATRSNLSASQFLQCQADDDCKLFAGACGSILAVNKNFNGLSNDINIPCPSELHGIRTKAAPQEAKTFMPYCNINVCDLRLLDKHATP